MQAETLDRHLREEGNRALERGALAALLLALSNMVLLPVVLFAGLAEGLWAPWVFTWVCAGSCLGLWWLAKQRALHGGTAWAAMLAFTSLPTAFFLGCELFLPAGAATFANGPLVLLYFILIALTGCLFDPRLSVASGWVAALGYAAVVAVAMPELAAIAHPDPLVQQDLVDPAIYVFKCVMLAFGGLLVAALAVVGRRLAIAVAEEAQGRAAMHRLLGTYVSAEVAERLVAGGEAGQRVDAVVLFCDLRGFTAYSESAEPEAIVERLNAYLEAMVTAIRAEGGVVDKFVGDAVMAVFGGLVPLANSAESAVRAARGMRGALADLNARWEGDFAHGIGIHAGELVQGAIGSPERRDYTVIGDVVNTASRVEGLTKDEAVAILVTEAVVDRLPDAEASRCRPLGERVVKGKSGRVAVYAVD